MITFANIKWPLMLIYLRKKENNMNVKKETDKEEERRFTLRLSEVESKAIEELKSLLRETTDSAVLRHIINNYKMLYLNHEEAKKQTIS
jgi:hypothetical protein